MAAATTPVRPKSLPPPDPTDHRRLGGDHRVPVHGRRSARSAPSPRSACTHHWPATCPIRGLSTRSARRGVGHLRPNGQDRAGPLRTARREVVTFDEIPKVLLDATTAVEDKTFWDNAGFDPVAIAAAGLSSIRGDSRGASTITQQIVRARLLDPALVQDPKPDDRAQAQGDHPVDPPDRGLPGRRGQAADHHRLPQPELLRQPELRGQGGGRLVLRDRPVEDHPGPGGDHRRAAQVAVELRPRPKRHRAVHDDGRRGRRVPAGQARWSSRTTPRSSSDATRSSTSWPRVARPMSGSDYTAAGLRGRQGRSGDPGEPGHAALDRAALRVGCPRRADHQAVRPGRADLRGHGAGRPSGHHHPRRPAPEDRREMGPGGGDRARTPRTRAAAAKALGFKSVEPWMTNLRDKDLRNGALVALDYQTGELVAYVGSANYYATSQRPEFQPQYDVAGKGYRQPGSAFKPFNYAVGIDDTRRDRRHDADGRRHRLRRQLLPDRRGQPRARPGPGPQRAPVLAQHPVRQDDGRSTAPTTSSPRRASSG